MAEQAISLGPRDVIGAALIKRAQCNDAFRAELMRDPRTVVERELGLLLPDRLQIQVRLETGARPLAMPRPDALAVPV